MIHVLLFVLLLFLIPRAIRAVGDIMMLMVCRAIPLGGAAASAWIVWKAMHDLLATCGAALVAFCAIIGAFDVGASSQSRTLRCITIGMELAGATAVSALLAFMLFHQFQQPLATGFTAACAGFFGFAAALNRRLAILEGSGADAERHMNPAPSVGASILKQFRRMHSETLGNADEHHKTWISAAALNPTKICEVDFRIERELLLAQAFALPELSYIFADKRTPVHPRTKRSNAYSLQGL